jgi:hypothetical protein
MGLEKTFREFSTRLRKLGDRIDELRLAVVVDTPPAKNDAVIVDNLEYAVEDMRGWLQETLRGARTAERAVGHPVDLEKARHALGICQERFRRIEQVYSSNLVSYERMKDLTSFGSERRGEWPSWVTSVKQGIEYCRQPLDDVRNQLAECWQEIAERVGMTSVSVRTTNIGQKVVSRAAEEAGHPGDNFK